MYWIPSLSHWKYVVPFDETRYTGGGIGFRVKSLVLAEFKMPMRQPGGVV